MSDREKEILLPVVFTHPSERGDVVEATHLSFAVYHRGYGERRGIAIRAMPVRIEPGSRLFDPLAGVDMLVEPCFRFSAPRLHAASERLFADALARKGQAWDVISKALDQHGLALAGEGQSTAQVQP